MSEFQLKPVFSGETFHTMVNYPVIVEMWSKIQYGRHKKSFERVFTLKERELLSKYHAVFRDWHLRRGVPDKVQLANMTHLGLLQRAESFFGTI